MEYLLMRLMPNTLINWKEKSITERVLWMDNKMDVTFLIDIYSNSYSPDFKDLAFIKDSINFGDAIILDEDPFYRIVREGDIKQNIKDRRDEAWEIVSYILESCDEPMIYNSEIRSKYINKASEIFGVSEKTIRGYLKRFWQRGMTKNALLPDFHRCGGKGNEKTAGKKKRGKPGRYRKGINVDDEIKKIFKKALKKYYYTTKENSLKTAYILMLKEYFADTYRYEEGIKKPILVNEDKLPSFGQFRYWFEKERNLKREVSTRKSAKRYFLENRDILGDSTQEVTGPGAVYQIDATIADVYLLSSYFKNEIIGRPVVYAVIDVYSRLVIGIYIGLEGPSWRGAMLALSNATMNKVEYCKGYGVNITESEWPVHGCIPEALLGDRGELEGKNIESFISALNIKVSNTASYRGDLKGIVESNFNAIDTRVKPFVPGAVGGDFQMRGGNDYRLDAKLTINQFTKIIIKCVLYHNNQHWLQDYKREEMMIEDDVQPIPIKLWNWGIKNKSGKLRRVNQDRVKLNLMPRNTATVTSRGLRFKGVYYGSKFALEERWFEKAKNKGNWKVDITYDPQCMDIIYMVLNNGRTIEKCFLLNHEDRYKNKTLEDIEFLLEYEKMKFEENRINEYQSKTDLMSDIEAIVKEAEEQSKIYEDSVESNAKRLQGIRKNRSKEKLLNREQERWQIGAEDNRNKKAKIQNIRENARENESNNEDIHLIKKMQRKKLRNGKNN